jgi:hypothetical protein
MSDLKIEDITTGGGAEATKGGRGVRALHRMADERREV